MSLRECGAFLPYVLQTETGRRVDAELGHIAVPVHHSDPTGPTTSLTAVRLRSTRPAVGPPTVLLAGGPGGSGIEWLTWDDDGWPEFVDGLLSVGDVIALDQRGTGASGPVPLSLEHWDLPLGEPGERAAVTARAIQRTEILREHWENRGLDLTMFSTEEIADDVAWVARAAGAEQVGLYGISFGSHLGLSVIRRHPQLVARAVLGLVEGPDHTHKLPSVVDAALERVSRRAASAPNLDASMPDLFDEVRALVDALSERPTSAVHAGVALALGAYDLQRAVADCLGSQDDLAELPARVRSMTKGDFGWLAGEAWERRTGWFPDAMYLHTDAASGASAARRERIRVEAGETVLGDAINVPFPDIETALGSPDLGDAFRAPIHSAVPVQFYSGGLDGRTPTSNAEEVMAGFPTSGHLVVEGIAHDDAIVSAAVRDRIVDFLATGEPRSESVAVPFAFRRLDG